MTWRNRVLSNARAYSRSAHGTQHNVPLSSTSIGEGPGNPLVILHGLFGSKRNWKSLTKAFHRALGDRPIYTLDLRNHGASPHARPHTYEAMAQDVGHFIEEKGLKNVSLLGHSMGGKTAMTLALSLAAAGKGDLLSHLIVVDMAPTRLPIDKRMSEYVTAMETINSMPRGMIKSLADADRALTSFEPDASIRQFLLTNLVLPSHSRIHSAHHQEKARYLLPLDLLGESISNLEEFPYDYSTLERPVWDGPACVIAGRQSEYHVLDHVDACKAFFPRTSFHALDTGHWVQTERPREFMKIVVEFLKSN